MDDIFLFAGSYDHLEDAKLDFSALEDLHADKWIGAFQAAVFEKRDDGKVKVVNTTSTTRTAGAKWGGILGIVFGMLFPASILFTAIEGVAVGAVAGNLAKGWTHWDVEAISRTLERGTAGVIVIAYVRPELGPEHVLRHAGTRTKAQLDQNSIEVREAFGES